MIFEFDPDKSAINLKKHGIDFETAKGLWLDEEALFLTAKNIADENRILILALYQEKIWAGIFTIRQYKIRIISVRRARKKEKEYYEKNH